MVIEQAHEYGRPAEVQAKGISPELKEVLHMLQAFEDEGRPDERDER